MSIKLKKIALITLVIPASIHWAGICIFSLYIFAQGAFLNLPSFFLTLVTLVGLFSLMVAIVSVVRYPKISEFTVYTIGLGCVSLIIAIYIGFYEVPQLLISATSLFLASAFIMVEYVRGPRNKSLTLDQ